MLTYMIACRACSKHFLPIIKSEPFTLIGIPCKAYHAGLRPKDRSKVLADWTSGEVPIVVATIAFGMGIDKAGKLLQPSLAITVCMPQIWLLHMAKF